MNKENRIGIIGGTFNPVHIAHLIIANLFVEELNLDICYYVPTNISPFKMEQQNKMSNTSQELDICNNHRLEMLRLALSGNPKFRIEDYEIKKKGISYTFETIRYFKKKFPKLTLFMLIGSDHVSRFREWRNWENILESVQICIANRPPQLIETEEILDILTIHDKKPIILNIPQLDISSTEIRKRVLEGKSIKYMVTKEVEEYIERNRLYI